MITSSVGAGSRSGTFLPTAGPLLAIVALSMLLLCAPALAHATLTGSAPVDGAVLQDNPDQVTLSFNEPVSVISATLIVPGGEAEPLHDFSSTGSSVALALPLDLSKGSHALSWRAVSEDGHPISGTTFFVIGSATTMQAADVPSSSSAVSALLWAARLLLFLGIFFGVGGAAFRILTELPAKARLPVQASIFGGLLAAPTVLALQGLDLAGAGLSKIFDYQVLLLGLKSPYGITVGLVAIALLAALVGLKVRSRPAIQALASVAVVLTGIAVGSSGHASVADPRWLTKPALFVHVTTIAWWVGALVPLILLLKGDIEESAGALTRFSKAIPYAIMPLLASGLILATVQLGPPSSTWLTPYGQILGAKLVLIVLLLAVASWNRWVLTAPAAKGDRKALRHMRRGIYAEIVLIVMVLGLVSCWRFTPPPRALQLQEDAPVTAALSRGSLEAEITFSSNRTGAMSIGIALDGSELPADGPRSVKVSLAPENETIAAVVRDASKTDHGLWAIHDFTVPLAGVWKVAVEVRVTDFDLVKLDGSVEFLP